VSVIGLARAEVIVAHCVAVHRRVVVRGDIDRRDDVFSEHTPERRVHGEFFHARDRLTNERMTSFALANRQSIGS